MGANGRFATSSYVAGMKKVISSAVRGKLDYNVRMLNQTKALLEDIHTRAGELTQQATLIPRHARPSPRTSRSRLTNHPCPLAPHRSREVASTEFSPSDTGGEVLGSRCGEGFYVRECTAVQMHRRFEPPEKRQTRHLRRFEYECHGLYCSKPLDKGYQAFKLQGADCTSPQWPDKSLVRLTQIK